MSYLIVFLGAGVGGALRHLVNVTVVRLVGWVFPIATLTVNVLGSFLVGLLAGYFASRTGLSQHLRLFLTTGVLRGFTTFSAFSLDVALLIERNSHWLAAGYVAGLVTLAIAGMFLGLSVFRETPVLP
jgi:fluoride exporter